MYVSFLCLRLYVRVIVIPTQRQAESKSPESQIMYPLLLPAVLAQLLVWVAVVPVACLEPHGQHVLDERRVQGRARPRAEVARFPHQLALACRFRPPAQASGGALRWSSGALRRSSGGWPSGGALRWSSGDLRRSSGGWPSSGALRWSSGALRRRSGVWPSAKVGRRHSDRR